MTLALVAGVVVAMVALVGCSSGSDGSSSAGEEGGEAPFELSGAPVETSEVTAVKSYKFEPAVIQVDAGTEVTWSKEDDFPHNVHLFESDETYDLPIGETASIAFDEAGEFYYECSIHRRRCAGR